MQLEQCLDTSAPVLCAISHNNHHASPITFMENPFLCRSSPAKAFMACASRWKQTNATKADDIIYKNINHHFKKPFWVYNIQKAEFEIIKTISYRRICKWQK